MNVGRHTLACECVKRPLLFCWIQSSDNGADVRWSWYRGHSPSARRSRSSPTKNKKTIHGGGELQGGEVRFHIPDWEGLWLPCWMQAPAVMWISHLAVAVYRKLENAGAKALHKSLFLTFDCTKSSQTVDKSGQNEIFFSWCLTFLIMAEWEAKKKRKKTGRKLEMSHCFSHWEEPAGSCTWLCGS